MARVGIVFCDLDDTFVAHDKTVPQANLAVLDLLAERGIPFVPCTGRGFFAIPEEIRSHPATLLSVTSSGAVVQDRSGNVVWERAIGRERTLALYQAVRDLDVTFDVFADGHIYASQRRFERMAHFGIEPGHLAHLSRSRTPVEEDVPQIVEAADLVERVGIFWGDGDAGARDAAAVRAAVDSISSLRWTTSYYLGMEVVDARASKGRALEWACGRLGVNVEDSVAFGDSPNDAEMIRTAGRGIAVENAYDELKAIADDVTASCDDAGVAVWLRAHL